jgi:uncharacterized protein YjbJ (UPF0337 family)
MLPGSHYQFQNIRCFRSGTDQSTGFLSTSILARHEIFGSKAANRGPKNARSVLKIGLDVGPMEPGGSMKPSTRDQIKGKALEVKGKVKETVGQVTNNPDLTTEGQAEQLVGKLQKKVGQIEKVFEK